MHNCTANSDRQKMFTPTRASNLPFTFLLRNLTPHPTEFQHQTLTTEALVIHNLTDLLAFLIERVLQVEFGGIVRVRVEHHGAVLPVKWEVCHLGGAAREINKMRSFQRKWNDIKTITSDGHKSDIYCSTFLLFSLERWFGDLSQDTTAFPYTGFVNSGLGATTLLMNLTLTPHELR